MKEECSMQQTAPKKTALEELLPEIEDFLMQYEDVRDGEGGKQLPNEAMYLLYQLRAAVQIPPRIVSNIKISPAIVRIGDLDYACLRSLTDGRCTQPHCTCSVVVKGFDVMEFYRNFPEGGNTNRGNWLERCLTAMCKAYAKHVISQGSK